jgi:hypothetical protein
MQIGLFVLIVRYVVIEMSLVTYVKSHWFFKLLTIFHVFFHVNLYGKDYFNKSTYPNTLD